ncbi:MAG: transcription-repair coupling factor [Anaerolineae bacterium]|nr:transcription-repair coupling factor [Anaerolineae bacterium]MDW7991930.1 transcription-repair coupling factor [Anaerolineae bacterium]
MVKKKARAIASPRNGAAGAVIVLSAGRTAAGDCGYRGRVGRLLSVIGRDYSTGGGGVKGCFPTSEICSTIYEYAMALSGLLSWISDLPPWRDLLTDLRSGDVPPPLGLLRAARPAVVAALARDLGRPILLVAGSVPRARALHQALTEWTPPGTAVLRFPEPPVLFYERAPWPRETVAARLAVLRALVAPPPGLVVVASARALMQPTLPVREFRAGFQTLQVGQMVDLEALLRRWAGLGYEPVSVVEAPGQFSHRGGIVDIFPPGDPGGLPFRIEFFGPQVESIRRFDPATQRSAERVSEVTVVPAREALPRHSPRALAQAEGLRSWLSAAHPPEIAEELAAHREALEAGVPFPTLEFYLPYFYSQPAALLDYLPTDGLLVLDDPAEIRDAWAELEEEAVGLRATAEREGAIPPDFPLPYITWDDWQEQLSDRPHLVLGHQEGEGGSDLASCFYPAPRYGGVLRDLMEDVDRALRRGEQVVIVSRQAQRLAEVWGEQRTPLPPVEGLPELPRQPVTFVQGMLEEGFVLTPIPRPPTPLEGESASTPQIPSLPDRERERGLRWEKGLRSEGATVFSAGRGARLLTDAEIFGWRMPEPRRPAYRRRVAPESLYADLTPGDYVVHVDFGIGIFRGLVNLKMEGEEREYLLVEYAGNDRLYVPVHQADRLSRYVGPDDVPPALSRLGSAEWAQVKERARRAVEEVARELLHLYAAREVARGHAFSPDTPWQAELEAAFPYVETPDQAKAIAEVKADMERPRPMDRLICGDAGYGKTEVALRAAFKAVMDGKQVAVLVPTTVLAQQHYITFRQRLAPFPVVVEHLSRFRTPAEQSRILEGLREGTVDIVIGTHRLLQKDVVFKDLGLVIIDEEQRFGVTHKEQLKKLRTEVDVLTLTATPIPRTLYLSLTGLRDISIIETPPEERLPVTTYVGPYDAALVRRAILRELERSGQVFYVHNRVQTIEAARARLARLVPQARIAVAHGQMPERDLEETMLRFVSGEVDVLLCTTIIESGLDIPNANTLIVENAERFGLAQLYQLRGRVGRGARRAYAYFLHTPGRLTEDARQRLETIREFSGLGAGYSIAMRDLELRGAGEILGTRQSGHIAAIGFDLYTRLLARAVEELKARREGRPPPPEPLSEIHLDLPLRAGLPPEYVPDRNLRLRLYRRLAALSSEGEIAAIGAELEDRFGPLPEEAQNLLMGLRLKVLARAARVSAIVTERDRVVLKRPGLAEERAALQALLGDLAHVGHQGISIPLGPDWLPRLREVLRRLAEGFGK